MCSVVSAILGHQPIYQFFSPCHPPCLQNKTKQKEARTEADARDRLVARSSPAERAALPPLFGVPIVAKECMQVAGMPRLLQH